ncbi:MAG: hypothetical protein UV38_C0002G0031 [candidate division TM6 bacterium GW2011_GWE2_42_60]|nr:MAG: hypothetical protein UV38_C0002G0031 [candidate division TM6 bacterium GW2011_GWE2_42_60]HBY06211.1 hypothetical protein [Candidatus Dependentiae bacterium]
MKRFLFFLSLLMIFPSCTRYVCWVKKTFRQTELCEACGAKEARAYVREEPVYDYFNTIDHFYVLWISPRVFEVHEGLMEGCISVCSLSEGGAKKCQEFADQTTHETKYLVLMSGVKKDWSFTLIVDDQHYPATKVVGTEIDRGYRGIFSEKTTHYPRNVYEVFFPVSVAGKTHKLQAFNGKHKVNFCWE